MRRKKRSPVALTLGIVHIVLASFGLLCSISQTIGAASSFRPPRDPGERVVHDVMNSRAPGWKNYELIRACVNLVSSIALMAFGIGLIAMQGWARLGTIVYAIPALLFSLFSLIYCLFVYLPALSESIYAVAGDSPQAQGTRIGAYLGVIFVVGLVLIHAIMSLILMLLPAVGEAFRKKSPRRNRYYEDDQDFEPQWDPS